MDTTLQNASILITGGTGSLGHALVKVIHEQYPGVRRVVIYSRDELKQYEMAKQYPAGEYGRDAKMRYFIGDVRDQARLRRAMEGIDYVIHAAALKQVTTAEYNPFECIQTNIMGAQNVIEACLDSSVKKVVALSTDKAAAPINLYGASKLCSDKLFVAANNFKGSRDIAFSVVRYGNVMGSRGSVIPYFIERQGSGVLPVTDPRMTRFNITAEQGARFVLETLSRMWGGEIFIPKIPSYKITDLATAVAPDCKQEVIGVRPGEKLHEEMITANDSLSAVDFGDRFAIMPSRKKWSEEEYIQEFGGSRCAEGFEYTSDKNKEWLSAEQLRELIKVHVDGGENI
ncbi:MAG: UDP-N-acetylglucosamine 4,6-dehydratase (inverting) [Parcubacteria group bacterium]|nr:UDP-N-acetylglucosamine 4,6-dehydratase (inverting) [Parcubacteria group bacterium]